MIPTLTKRPRLRPGMVLTLDELDRLLDVRVRDFDSTVARLVKEFRKRALSVRVPESHELGAGPDPGNRVAWSGLFEAQAQRLAKLDRAEEFLMARRYEFLKARAAAALREVGYPDDQIEELMRHGRSHL